jgi:hypothetical protein
MSRPGLARAAILVWGLLVACSNPVCGCSPVDPQANVVVSGLVLDSSATPLLGAEIILLEPIRLDCAKDGHGTFTIPDRAVSDASGRFTMVVQTWALPGTHCINLLARLLSTGAADTVRAVPAVFRDFPPFDTVQVQFVVPD